MDNLASVIYEKFFMRDLLGKLTPGAISMLAVFYLLVPDAFNTLYMKSWPWIFWLLAIPLCLLAGLGLQIMGELLGVHAASPFPQWVVFVRIGGRWDRANRQFRTRQAIFLTTPDGKLPRAVQAQRERLVYLREGSGNLALALAVWLGILMIKPIEGFGANVRASLFIVIAVLLFCHFLHGARQAIIETRALGRAGLITPEQEREMLEQIPFSSGGGGD